MFWLTVAGLIILYAIISVSIVLWIERPEIRDSVKRALRQGPTK